MWFTDRLDIVAEGGYNDQNDTKISGVSIRSGADAIHRDRAHWKGAGMEGVKTLRCYEVRSDFMRKG